MTVHTNVQKFVAALVAPVQALEDAYQQVLARTVDNAVGVHLTGFGKIVGREREGITDDELLRRYVRAQTVTNRSSGTIDEALTIADLIVYDDDADYVLDNQGAAAFVLRIEGIVTSSLVAETLLAFLQKAVKGGVRVIIEFFSSPIEDTLIWGGPGTWGDSDWAAGID